MLFFSVGIDFDTIKFISSRKELNFTDLEVLTIGRMRWYGGSQGVRLLKKITQKQIKVDDYSEFVFRALGAKNIQALDLSEYEGASIIHDLNNPIGTEYESSFDVVIDSGSLEHIFNCQEALFSYMRMCKIGGHLILVLPTNNQMGHGLYQFSPEYFYRTLGCKNGFIIETMLLKTDSFLGGWYKLEDPQILKFRQEIRTHGRSMLFIHAKKIGIHKKPINVIQSDYVPTTRNTISKRGQLFLNLPTPLKSFVTRIIIRPRYRCISWRNLHKIRI